jgi:hypothetical protein
MALGRECWNPFGKRDVEECGLRVSSKVQEARGVARSSGGERERERRKRTTEESERGNLEKERHHRGRRVRRCN